MVGQNQTFAEGASINRPPLFTGENYLSGKLGCKFFWNLFIEVFGM